MGGKAEDGYIEATIVDVDNNPDALTKEEVFGPALTVITVREFDAAISIVNEISYELAASISPANTKHTTRGARMLQAGRHGYCERLWRSDISTPFRGYKQSGFGGPDNGIHAYDQYTQLKII